MGSKVISLKRVKISRSSHSDVEVYCEQIMAFHPLLVFLRLRRDKSKYYAYQALINWPELPYNSRLKIPSHRIVLLCCRSV